MIINRTIDNRLHKLHIHTTIYKRLKFTVVFLLILIILPFRTAEILFNILGARRGGDGMVTYQLSISERDLYCTKCDLSDTRAEDSEWQMAVADGRWHLLSSYGILTQVYVL